MSPKSTHKATLEQTHRGKEGILKVKSCPASKSDLMCEATGWSSGFPYFGEAAEALDALGLWNRTSLQAVLYKGSRKFLGDKIFYRLQKARWATGRLLAASVEVIDPENGAIHRLRYRARSR